jgi:hypothetical protein
MGTSSGPRPHNAQFEHKGDKKKIGSADIMRFRRLPMRLQAGDAPEAIAQSSIRLKVACEKVASRGSGTVLEESKCNGTHIASTTR